MNVFAEKLSNAQIHRATPPSLKLSALQENPRTDTITEFTARTLEFKDKKARARTST
ncbi:hypothetical protein ABZ484_28985 [Streptomyces sp. NPDC006393]|uniref:hypothetical protein n=1 Tax=Streptomyces sp. NPDC006393 TaxID=3156763 RepID=UPI003405F4D8